MSAFYLSNVETYLSQPQRGGSQEKVKAFYQKCRGLTCGSIEPLYSIHRRAECHQPPMVERCLAAEAVSPMLDLSTRIKAGGNPTYAEALQMTPDPKTLVP